MGDLVTKVTTDLTFHEGRLVPVGTPITIDVTQGTFTDDNTPNLVDPGKGPMNVAVPVAPIAPTGPNPTMPQQVPPGVFQTTAGYVAPGGALLVGEGSQAAADAGKGPSIDDQMEEEAPVRRQFSEATGDATTAAQQPTRAFGISDAERAELAELRQSRTQALAAGSSTVGTAGPAPVENGQNSNATGAPSEGFNAEGVVDGTVPEVAARLEGLTREQLVAVRAAEQDREQPRSGVTHAIDAAIAKLDDEGGQA